MFGIYNDTQPKDQTQQTADDSAPVFGGFDSRWSYEQYMSGQRNYGLPRRMIYVCLGLFVVLTGVLGGIIMFDVVESNKSLYYPEGTLAEHFTVKSDSSALHLAPIHDKKSAAPYAEDVTPELAKRYRIPMGVMIKHLDRTSAAYLAGIRPGDIIVSVDAVEITTLESLEAVSAAIGSDSTTVTVFRNNEYLEFSVQ